MHMKQNSSSYGDTVENYKKMLPQGGRQRKYHVVEHQDQVPLKGIRISLVPAQHQWTGFNVSYKDK